jgi:hypothetical protein
LTDEMPPSVDNRATPRIAKKVALTAEGRDVYHKPFQEETHTVLVNEGGALIALGAELQLQDRFRVVNGETGVASDCRVAWRSAEPIQGRWSYGIALLAAPENFWGPTQS